MVDPQRLCQFEGLLWLDFLAKSMEQFISPLMIQMAFLELSLQSDPYGLFVCLLKHSRGSVAKKEKTA